MMHDRYYRASIAMQNNHYNQPANVSYYLGAETTEIPVPEMYTIHNGQKIENTDTVKTYSVIPQDDITANKTGDGKIEFKVNIDAEDKTLILARYRDGKLEKAYVNVTSGNFTDAGGEYILKAFVWDGMTPFRPAVTVKVE